MLRRIIKRLLALVFIAALAMPAAAQAPGGGSDQDFFQPPYDRSAEMVRGMFGDAWMDAAFSGSAPGSPAGGTSPFRSEVGGISTDDGGLLGVICEVLGLAMLGLCAVVIFSTWGTALANSAYEGVAMGQNYHGFWVPVRSTLSLFLLIPWQSGYSFVHYFFLKAVSFSLAAASIGYGQIVDYVGSGHSLAAMPTTEDAQKWGSAVEAMVYGEACMLLQNSIPDVDGTTPARVERVSAIANSLDDVGISKTVTFAYKSVGSTAAAGNPCGSVSLLQSIQQKPAALTNAQNNLLQCKAGAMTQGREEARNLAVKLLNGEPVTYYSAREVSAKIRAKIENSCIPPFESVMQQIADQGLSQTTPESSSGTSNQAWAGRTMKEVMLANGWLFAGSYYFTYAKTLTARANSLGKAPEASVPSPSAEGSMTSFDQEFEARMAPVRALLVASNRVTVNQSDNEDFVRESAQSLAGREGETQTGAEDGLNLVSKYMQSAGVFAVTKLWGGSGDSLAEMASTGHTFLLAGGGMKVASAGGAILSHVTGMDGIIKPVIELLGELGTLLIAIGAYLAYWLPAIPWMLWISSVTAWICSLILAAMCLPVWAMAHAFPEGDGWAGRQAQNGYMLLLSTAISPLLNIGGFFAGMLVVQLIGWLIMSSFSVMLADITGSNTSGIFGILFTVVIVAAAISGTANKAFDLSFEARDAILKWIGGGVEQLGDKSTLEKSNQLIATFGGRAGGVGNLRPGMGGGGRDRGGKPGGGTASRAPRTSAGA